MCPLKVRDPSIWRRLARRYNLEDFALPVEGKMSEVIQPVTQMDDLVAVRTMGEDTEDISAAAGTQVTFFTVPNGKRWKLKWIWRQGCTAATRVFINNGTVALYLTAAATSEQIENPVGIELEEGWVIGCLTTGDGGDAARVLRIYYLEEDAYQVMNT